MSIYTTLSRAESTYLGQGFVLHSEVSSVPKVCVSGHAALLRTGENEAILFGAEAGRTKK